MSRMEQPLERVEVRACNERVDSTRAERDLSQRLLPDGTQRAENALTEE